MNRQPGALSVTGVVALVALCLLFSAQTACAQGDSRRASPPAGKALVFVFRSDRQPVAGQLPVTVSGNKLGELANGTYVTATVNPGRAFLRIGDRVVNTLSFAVAANQSYFVMVEAVPGVRPLRAVLNLVSEATGRRALAQSRFVGAGAAPILAAPRAAQAAEVPKRVPPAPAAAARPQPPSRAAQPAPRPAPAARVYTPSVQEQGWDLAFIAKAGVFKMANDSQVVGGLPSTYDANSAWVGGFEFEWRSRKGPAAGVELFYYKNDLTANGTGLGGRQTVGAYMLNGKYYFRAADRWYPFVGVGVGATNASYSGNLTGKASGFAYQGLAGIEFRYENLGVLLQYKYLASTTDDGAGEKVKVGGNGILAGVSLSF
jgi:opacity protein-like surface antigen